MNARKALNGYVLELQTPKTSILRAQYGRENFEAFRNHSEPDLREVRPPYRFLLAAGLAELVGTDPLSFDGPGAKALVIGIIAGEMAMFD